MAEQIILPRRVLDANGDPLSGAKLYAYVEGTTTLEAIYTTSALSTAHPSPLVSDSGGNFPPIWHAGDHGVKVKITDASDVEISWSPLDPCPATSSATTASNISFTPTTNNPASDVQEAIDNASDNGRAILDKASNYTVLATDRTKVIRCTANLTLSLSAADVLGAGWFTQVMADGGDVTIDPDGSETIEGDTTKILYDGEDGFIHCDGTDLYLIKASHALGDVSSFSIGATGTLTTGLPAWANRIDIMLSGASLDSTDDILIQLGTSSGVVTSGYVSASQSSKSATLTYSNSTSGLIIRLNAAAVTCHGMMSLVHRGGNIWASMHSCRLGSNEVCHGGGDIDVGGTVDRVQITRTGGNFDGGGASVRWSV